MGGHQVSQSGKLWTPLHSPNWSPHLAAWLSPTGHQFSAFLFQGLFLSLQCHLSPQTTTKWEVYASCCSDKGQVATEHGLWVGRAWSSLTPSFFPPWSHSLLSGSSWAGPLPEGTGNTNRPSRKEGMKSSARGCIHTESTHLNLLTTVTSVLMAETSSWPSLWKWCWNPSQKRMPWSDQSCWQQTRKQWSLGGQSDSELVGHGWGTSKMIGVSQRSLVLFLQDRPLIHWFFHVYCCWEINPGDKDISLIFFNDLCAMVWPKF